jgi:transposase
MARALSLDLRGRVVEAVANGMSCRQAAARFGVSASSAIRWAAQVRSGRALAPMKQGGDRRSQHIEAEAAFILGVVEEKPDLTLAEIQTRLNERGKRAGIGTLCRFFQHHGISDNSFNESDNLMDAFAPVPPAGALKRRLAHIFVIGLMLANGMLTEFQMRCDVPVSEQGKAKSCAQCQNVFNTFEVPVHVRG